jgi:outer membrane receptor for ferrienterochelin and colicins
MVAGVEYIEDKRDAAFFDRDGKMTTKTLDNTSAFAQYEWQVSAPWSIIGGLRYDDTTSGGDATTANLGTVYQLNPMMNLRARYAQGFRAPYAQELYINRFNPQGRRFVGSQVVDASINKQAFDLKAEKSENIELGISGRNQAWFYDLAVFNTDISDNILRQNTQDYLSFRNAKSVTIQGMDARMGWKMHSDVDMDLALNLLDTKDKETQQRLEYMPDFVARLGVNYQVTPSFRTRVDVQHVGDQLYSITSQGQTRYLETDAYTLVNLNLNYAPSQWQQAEIFGGVNNLFNAKVDKELGSDPGTYVHAGVRVYF